MKRRDFIALVAASGGSAYAAMQSLDLLGKPAVAQTSGGSIGSGTFRLPKGGGGKKVIILGAGLGGMTSAYEMMKVGGYDITILEARDRAGGRCWTLRDGDTLTETTGTNQRCRFRARGETDYFNPGPARIPQHHVTIDYCKELGVELEVFANANYQTYYYRDDVPSALSNRPVRVREARADMRGYISELLAKAIDQNALNAELSVADQEQMIAFLQTYGSLDPDLVYTGSSRRGYVEPEGGGLRPGVVGSPYDLSALINLGFQGYDAFEQSYDQQMLMFEPVGGMDMIAKAFEREVGSKIKFGSEVTEIRKTSNGVRVVYRQGGSTRAVTGDYCICNIPLSVLRTIPSDFSPRMQEAIASVNYAVTGKSGLMYKNRFWEDEDILAGITWTNLPIGTIWYPSHDYLSKAGLVVGYYNFGSTAASFGEMAPRERVAMAVDLGTRIHGARYRQDFVSGVSLFWPQIPYSLGGWASYSSAVREQYYPILNQPDGNIYLCGEHLSYLTGWMAGAFESARIVTSSISARS
ncbi:MAG: flavin monoamine oxidase family protein [Cyanobacteria bacterium P01_D01_bin.14]